MIEYSHGKTIRHILLTFNKKTDPRTSQKIVFHEKQNSRKSLLEQWLDYSITDLNRIELDSITTIKKFCTTVKQSPLFSNT